ncbi:DUF4132 domain-containing protein [Gordonia sp. VNQ95]|jgi:hypothetical protein|uniref:DUF4132 domain-containing protein n=1 Tax=Gordonia TaxID=2053 RepID=UPI0032B5ED4E
MSSNDEVSSSTGDSLWVTVGETELSLKDGEVVARRLDGTALPSVPEAVYGTPEYTQLRELGDLLVRHDSHSHAEVQRWVSTGMPVRTLLLGELWPDPTWRRWLRNLAVVPIRDVTTPVDADDPPSAGFLHRVVPDPHSDETAVIEVLAPLDTMVSVRCENVVFPHPATLGAELDQLRRFAEDTGIEQPVEQIHRMTFRYRPDDRAYVNLDFQGREFRDKHAVSDAALAHGFRVHDGRVVTRIVADGAVYEAHLLFDDEYGVTTDTLRWLCHDEVVRIHHLPAAVYSEGVRMATLVCERAR